MGLSFSVPEGIKIPSSLGNIFKELEKDLGCTVPSHGNLERWAVQVNIQSCYKREYMQLYIDIS
jgi:uracil DNA glycosylase